MSKSTETTVAQNINATLSVEDIPMNENVTLAQLNEDASAKAENKENKEKKEKYSLTRETSDLVAKVEKALNGNAGQIKALQGALKTFIAAGLDTSAVLAGIDKLRAEGTVNVDTVEFQAEIGREFIEIIKRKLAQ